MAWAGAWPSHDLAESRRRLVELHKELDQLTDDVSPEVEQAICRFLVVRTCGHIEFTFEESFCLFTSARSSPGVADFVRSGFFRGSNPSPGRIVGTLEKLDKNRARVLSDYLDDNDQVVKRELAYLVDRRNKIAHGQNETVRKRRALDLAQVGLDLGDWMVTTLDPR